jgi:hypothetical protein
VGSCLAVSACMPSFTPLGCVASCPFRWAMMCSLQLPSLVHIPELPHHVGGRRSSNMMSYNMPCARATRVRCKGLVTSYTHPSFHMTSARRDMSTTRSPSNLASGVPTRTVPGVLPAPRRRMAAEPRCTAAPVRGCVRGLNEKVHRFRRCGFTKALLCIAVMSPLARSELLVCT